MEMRPLQVVVSSARKRVETCEANCQEDSIVKICNSHGEQGWQLAAITSSKLAGHLRLIFQRANQIDPKCVK